MIRAATRAEVRAEVARARSQGRRIGLVPTMGYLHDAHLSLVDTARHETDFIVLSIFVNPLQFGPAEDFARYPRDLERDASLAAGRGVDLLFAPSVEEMYPNGDAAVRVTPGALAERLCGEFRPGHFEGVLTVVAKLFNIVAPDVAVFGQKDFQQYALIARMAADLDMPVTVRMAPTGREPDGLALSSRNVYLSAEERRQAAALSRGLFRAGDAFDAGERDAKALIALVSGELAAQPLVKTQYVELVDAHTLHDVTRADKGSVLAVAAFLGATRLIDNIVL